MTARRYLTRTLAALAVAALAHLTLAGADAQTPSAQPVYGVTTQLTAQSIAAAPNVATVLNVNVGFGGGSIRVSGTFTGLVATVQGSNDPMSVAAASASWNDLPLAPISDSGSGGATGGNGYKITSTGFWRYNTTGLARVRLNVTAIASGTAVANLAGMQQDARATLGANRSLDPLVTYTSQGLSGAIAQLSSPDVLNLDGSTVMCVLNLTAYTGSGNAQLVISNKDPGSGLYREIARSNLIPAGYTGQTPLTVGKGAAATSGVSVNSVLGSRWNTMVTGTVGGVISGTVGCDLIK